MKKILNNKSTDSTLNYLKFILVKPSKEDIYLNMYKLYFFDGMFYI